ncbi:MAG TPA: glucan biosynthesis protein D, partial [Polyangiales bacterium]|nr:glucan biosynthesis protein D [Polyangiales bacterium]
MSRFGRRTFLRAALLACSASPLLARAQGLQLGKARPFSFALLTDRARKLAAQPYRAPELPAPELVKKLDYETVGRIHYKVDYALDGQFPTTFFHLGSYFPKSIRIYALAKGQARELGYDARYFDMPADSPARKLPKNSGFAGFHVHESRQRSDWKTQDWVAFLGASYFRSIGALNQYGLSARGLAVNTTSPAGEEFPDFREFYLESPARADQPMMIYALLDGPSVCGAYRFACTRGTGVVMDVECALFFREDVQQLGVAPLTSMFWYSEYDKAYRIDWRPEVHDSDGLALFTGGGERIWRPLNNPGRTVTSSFFDRSPRGFGLLQRDRVADHYLDGVRYENRPSLWVEPIGDWGEGCVQLVEIPTDDEIHDNVVAFWRPSSPAKKGGRASYRYRLHWLADEPFPSSVARVVATRIGRGGEPGKPRPKGLTKFVVDFEGGAIEQPGLKVAATITPSRGEISYVFVERVPGTKQLRAQFDLKAEGTDAVELRMFLVADDK